MKIEIVRHIGFEELVRKLKQVPLKKTTEEERDVLVYEEANITLKRLTHDQVNPPTFYLLRHNL
ncbi:MAG: hypothetical protein AABY10_05605, partial [Nanoarchaeota archaeon]